MSRILGTVVALTICLALALSPVRAQQKATTEKEKIEALIKHVGELKDAQFVRNDVQYDAKTAAKYLRAKWEAHENDVKTAKDFIEKIASVSSTTGKPYLIRLKGGKETKCGEYFLAELKKIEKSSEGKRGP